MLVLFLAYFLQTRIHQMDDWKGTILRAVLPPLVFIGFDLEGAGSGDGDGVRGGDGADAVPGGDADEVLCGAVLRCAAPVLYYMLFHVAFRRARMLAFVNPEADPAGPGFISCSR